MVEVTHTQRATEEERQMRREVAQKIVKIVEEAMRLAEVNPTLSTELIRKNLSILLVLYKRFCCI